MPERHCPRRTCKKVVLGGKSIRGKNVPLSPFVDKFSSCTKQDCTLPNNIYILNSTSEIMVKITKEAALHYHEMGKPGKIEVVPTKPYRTQTDLSLAYSPGVAEPCLEISYYYFDL